MWCYKVSSRTTPGVVFFFWGVVWCCHGSGVVGEQQLQHDSSVGVARPSSHDINPESLSVHTSIHTYTPAAPRTAP